MKVFHRTPCGSQIVAAGFKDNTGHYMLGITLTGVFVSDKPLDLNEGAKGRDLLCLEIPEAVFSEFELVEDEKPYREACIPASVLNGFGNIELLPDDFGFEVD